MSTTRRSELIHPPALSPGDRIIAYSPSGPVLHEHILPGIRHLESLGFEVLVPDATLAKDPDRGYFAGPDPARLQALQDILLDPCARAIVCARGGYGAMRLLPDLDPDAWRAHPKLLLGFSDVTALHLWSAGVAGVSSLHGPVLKSLRRHDPMSPTATHLARALRGQRAPGWSFDGLTPVTSGQVTGPVFGGNLTLLVSLLGSPYLPSLDGAIVFIEDISEPDYRLDRLFTALRLATPALGGLVLGDFTDCHGVYVEEEAMAGFLRDLAKEFGCPAVMGLPAGHEARNIPIPIGVQSTLDATNGTWTFHQDTCSQGPS